MSVPNAHHRHPQRVRVKICGITRQEDAMAAVHLGADAIGLVFYAGSPRAVSPQQARAITALLPPFVTKVGLFVNPKPAEVRYALSEVPIDLLQFHGEEADVDCYGFGRPYIKAVRVREGVDLETGAGNYPHACGLLFDTFVEGVAGGTGQRFDWSLIPAQRQRPLILAGGLTPDNVAEAIRGVRPYAVDVSGGVEIRKGIKDQDRMRRFIQRVRDVECDCGRGG